VLSIELLGLVQMDAQVVTSTNTGVPLVLQKNSEAGQAFRRIASRLNGHKELPIQIPSTSKSIWKKIGQKIGIGK
jgi:septum site-determining protein MinD